MAVRLHKIVKVQLYEQDVEENINIDNNVPIDGSLSDNGLMESIIQDIAQ